MRKPQKIALCCAGILLAAGAAGLLWQWENITALRYAVTMDSQTVEQGIAQNDQRLKDVMEQYRIEEHTFSSQELGEISGDEAALDKATEALLAPKEQPAAADSKPASAKPAMAEKPQAARHEQEIRAQIAKMYVLKATYVSALDGIVANTIAEYTAIPAEKRTAAKKQEVVMSRMSELSALEKSCDQKVAGVVTELRRLLKADRQDGAVADLVEKTYAEEKSLKKAYYINQFRN